MAWVDIKGHKNEIDFLISAEKKDRLANSLLFLGPEGIGKKLVALEFAKFLLCKSSLQENPCEKCTSCLQVRANSHPDLHIISLNSLDWIKIDQMREFQEKIYMSPYSSKRKIFIIDNAHMLTLEAANSLLKVMEEPPLNTILILITNKIDSCQETIVSRCQRIYFSPLATQDIEELLSQKAQVVGNVTHFLSRFSQGSVSEAISLSKYKNFQVDKSRLLSAILDKDNLSINDLANELDRQYLGTIIEFMISFFRDALFIRLRLGSDLLINIDEPGKLNLLAGNMQFKDIQASLADLFKAQELNKANANSKILLTWLIGNLRERVRPNYAR
ncbi:MAG: DNA polymerase III subunit delta' [Candidatus Omnitrophota bacterium]